MRSAVLVVLAGVLALAAPAQAHHTPVPGVVALVGSLQSELGCPGDWQPECAQTRLQPVAGSPGVFRGDVRRAGRSYEYKVALNNSWDENYGAGGAPGGANIALDAPGGALTFTYDHATHVITDDTPEVARQRARPRTGCARGADRLGGARRRADATGCTRRPRAGSSVAGRRDRRRRLVPAHARADTAGCPTSSRTSRRSTRFELSEARPARRARAAHRPAGRRRLRRRRRARRRDRRADPRRPRRPLRGRGARPARPDLARTHAAARRVGADGQGRRRCCRSASAARRDATAGATACGASRAGRRGGTRRTPTRSTVYVPTPTRSSPTW